jgi:Zn-dependent protease with chaperone function
MRLNQKYSFDSLVLYALTLGLEVPVIMLRMVIVSLFMTIVLAATGHSTGSTVEWGDFALVPTGWSLIALVSPAGSGWWWRQRAGGREPSEREKLAYQDAMELLQDNAGEPLPAPEVWFVLDTPEPDAAVVGDALMLSRGLLESPQLPAVLAHELGHLGSPDGRVTAALNRLVIHPLLYEREPEKREEERRREPTPFEFRDEKLAFAANALYIAAWVTRRLLRFARGGIGLYLMRPALGGYWREREYAADRYAAALGQADELADFLEVHALIHDHPIPFIWLTEHAHPPTELRVDKLRTLAHTPPAPPAPAPEWTDTDTDADTEGGLPDAA